MSSPGSPEGGQDRQPSIAEAITEVSERASALIRDEIELAKAEVTAKISRLTRGAIVAAAAGIFVITALLFFLQGIAWLLYFELPIGSQFTYFWGFFVLAAILLALGGLAGLLAFRAVRSSAPPTPTMAIDEARKIRATVGAGSADSKDAS